MAPSVTETIPTNSVAETINEPKPKTTTQEVETLPNGSSDVSDANATLQHLREQPNPSLYVTPQHALSLKHSNIPTPGPMEVVIHVRCTGICGSDLHLWHRGAIGPLRVTCDSILGHEAAGVVVLTGLAVTNLKPGDRVAIEPGVPCHTCFLCRSGRYNLCESVSFAGVCPSPGTIRRYTVHDSRYCYKIPSTMSFAQAALLEPLSVIMHAVDQCEGSIGIGRPALVCGAGPIGLIALAAAKASGAWPLVITDVESLRLDFAASFVPGTKTYHVDPSKSSLECAEEIRQIFGCGPRKNLEGGTGAEDEYVAPKTVLECTGIESSVVTAAYSCRRGGTVMVVGVGRSIMNNLPFMHLSLAEIQLKFINRYRDTWPAAINALAEHRILNLDALVTHTFPLERAVEALELAADRQKGSIKIQIVDG